MPGKTVLIVDDSKTAQVRLRKMLQKFDVKVDISFSAEEALGYLSHTMPAVIFMDHHMEGMDGLEALKIIKANPNTAVIPVIMYTSEKGDVYVGQARALGALDILSKEIIKPENLSRVLARLNIIPREQAAVEKNQNITSQTDQSQIKNQIAHLFELHIADVRQQITGHTKFIVRRLGSEIRNLESDRKTKLPEPDIEEKIGKIYPEEPATRGTNLSNILLLALLIGIVYLGFELQRLEHKVLVLASSYTEMVRTDQVENTLIADLKPELPSVNTADEVKSDSDYLPGPSKVSTDSALVMDSLNWAFNADLPFGYNQPPLGETQVTQISNLVYLLDSVGYKGEVQLQIHFGNLCLQVNSSGEWHLANPKLPISQCIMYKEVNSDFFPNTFLSTDYLTLVQTAPPLNNGNINLKVTSRDFGLPLQAYPEDSGNTTAGEWNQKALKNNRVSVLLKKY